ncbi:extracellular solute-binding protein [Propioniciclava sp.]|uniref:ABC transporter substrate-binding protein n=1 Tax=Propioniciclava sp. TaxID=2038686 RepID=UPI0026343726|nr:extracellular solute-binding protein [Propioniciclava sp.]
MSLTRRSLLTLGGGLAAASALAACGSNTGRTSEPTVAPTAGSGAVPALSQWYHQYGEDGVEEAVRAWAAEFGGATVNVNWVLANYEDALAAALLTPTAPDVFEYANGPTLDMIKAGQVVDLTDAVGDAASQFTPSVLARMTYDNKIWAIPQTVDMQLLYYRKSVLAAAGVDAPDTLEELTAVANAVATPEMGGFFAGNDGGIGVLGLLLMWAAGVEEMNEDHTEAAFNTPDLYEAVAQYKALFDSPGMVKSASADWSDASPFINGETAMQWGGLWDLPKVTAAHGDDVGVLPFPSAGGAQVVPFGAFSACVAASSANVDVAKEFVKWLWVDSDDKQVQFSDAFGTHIPAKPALFDEASQVASGVGSDAAGFVTDLGRSNALFWTSASGQAYSTALSNVVLKGADAASEFGSAADAVTAELKRVNG